LDATPKIVDNCFRNSQQLKKKPDAKCEAFQSMLQHLIVKF
jgi:hypothetical protein